MFCPYPVSSEWHTHLDSSSERSKNFKYWTGCSPPNIEDLITVRSRPREVGVMLRSLPCWLPWPTVDRCWEFKESLFFRDLRPPANELQTVSLMELNIMKFPFVLTFTITIFTWQDEMFVFWCYLTEKHYDPNLHIKVTLLCLMTFQIHQGHPHYRGLEYIFSNKIQTWRWTILICFHLLLTYHA